MPAIQPARLRQQAVLITQHFDNPAAFVRSLHHLFEFYADRARRPGQSGIPGPLLSAYKVHPPVLRQILLELTPLATAKPEQGLALCDALWQEPYLEFRMLSAMLLGKIPVESPQQIITRLEHWIKPDLEDHLIDILFKNSMIHLREENPEAMLRLIHSWMVESEPLKQQVGLRALMPLIKDPEFENLPTIFRLINPLARTAHPSLRQDLLDVIVALARRSPKETAYFLRKTLELPSATDTPWLIRQSLPEFPSDIQTSLRDSVRGKDWQPVESLLVEDEEGV